MLPPKFYFVKGNSEFEFVNFTTDVEYFEVAGDTFVKVGGYSRGRPD